VPALRLGVNVDQSSASATFEGSVQRDQNRVRVNAQLIYTGSGAHLWAPDRSIRA
jgi:TolB-like protein